MNFNTPNDFYHFLVGNGLVGLCPETQNLVSCMDVLMRMCSCDPQDKKQAKFNQCKQSYVAFATRAQTYSSRLFGKLSNETRINFYLNNQLLSSLIR